ncbi:MAG: response regulator [Methylophilaceae bacterium]|nr:response regulator [Methylophilaceae bacterium]
MKKILIADDEQHIVRVLKLYLEREGYTVQTAADGQAALAMILENPPDVLITDIHMPRMTGQALCLALVEQLPTRAFPIFVMTSMTDREHREWTKKIERLEFLEKPLSMRTMLTRLNKVFSDAQASAEVIKEPSNA